MIQGILRQQGKEWVVEYRTTVYSAPVWQITTWRVTGIRREAHYGPAPDMVDGLTVDSIRDRDAWQAYAHGNYLVLETEHNGTRREEPYPCPKVRRGVEMRYHDGVWQKYLKTQGWVSA